MAVVGPERDFDSDLALFKETSGIPSGQGLIQFRVHKKN